ncbi:hypothetical protein KBD69_03245 [Candidatus Woesebacteria bacterium]|nr:hypothetical protein [Candidatus Woesebacteria bacterium]
MRRILRWFSLQKAVLFLILGVVIYQSRLGSAEWLLGWDSLVPELNWKLNFSRAILGAWQEYQGVGLTGGMAHLADLSRMILLWVINLVLPAQYVRWTWHMGMLVIGPVGMWYLGKKLWKWSESASLAASVFYLLNLATIQYYFVPYEAFSSFYGFLPWLTAVYLTYLVTGAKKDLGKMVILGLLSTSAFYVQTLFVVYVIALGILSLGYLKNWKRVFAGLLTIFIVNAFWLLPVIYGVITGGGQVGLAKINSIASSETTLMNDGFGKWSDVVSLKGYWLEYIEWIGGGDWGRLMQLWWEWSAKGWVMGLGQILFGISVLGIVWGVLLKKMKWGWLGGLLLAYIMVSSFNSPFGVIYQFLVDRIPLFGEMFRSVFTKWSVVLALFVSVGIGILVAGIKNKWVAGIVASIIVAGCAGIVWPVFKPGIIFDKMKVELPGAYLKMFEFMKSQSKDGRVAYLPTQDMWSWKYTDWGYRGSGFLWYGIEQPILDRAFDVWSPYNEGFYNEFSTALYGGSGEKVKQILNKYDVRYVLLDESVIAPGQDKEILRVEETKRMSEELGWVQKFNEGFLTVWEVNNSQITNDKSPNGEQWISTPKTYTLAEGEVIKAREDVIFEDNGSYVSGIGGMQFPFANLMKENPTSSTTSLGAGKLEDVEWGEGGVRIIANHKFSNSQMIIIPGWEVGEIVRVDFATSSATTLGTQWEPLPAYYVNDQTGPVFLGEEKPADGKSYFFSRISAGEEWREYRADQKFEIRNEKLEIAVRGEPFVYDFTKQGQGSIGNCDVLKRGVATKTENTYFADERGAVCDYVVMEAPFTRVPHLLRLRGENTEGRSIKFFLYNTGSKRNDIEYLLGKGKFDQTFSLLPWDWDGYYTLNIETRSFGQSAENKIEPVVGMYVPLDKIAKAKIVDDRNSGLPVMNNANVKYVKKTGTWLYGLGVKGDGLIRLSQGYDEGWIGINIGDWNWKNPFDSAQSLRHVKVDGWANGFILNNESGITNNTNQIVIIFYWPQLLQYLGFVVLGITVFLLVLPVKIKSK